MPLDLPPQPPHSSRTEHLIRAELLSGLQEEREFISSAMSSFQSAESSFMSEFSSDDGSSTGHALSLRAVSPVPKRKGPSDGQTSRRGAVVQDSNLAPPILGRGVALFRAGARMPYGSAHLECSAVRDPKVVTRLFTTDLAQVRSRNARCPLQYSLQCGRNAKALSPVIGYDTRVLRSVAIGCSGRPARLLLRGHLEHHHVLGD